MTELVSVRNGQVNPQIEPYHSMVLVAPDHIEVGTGRLLKKESAASQGAISGKYLVEPRDIIYSKIRPYLQKAIVSDFTGLCSADMYPLIPKRGVDSTYILNLILSRPFTEFAISVSARSGIPKINRAELAEFFTVAPPPVEQKAIGGVLTDIDNLVASLEHLISKKQAIKQGIMQKLLTGETRLPGCTEPWMDSTIGDLAQVVSGGTPKSSMPAYWDGGIAWCTPTDITREHGRYLYSTARTITPEGLENSSAQLLPKGTVLLCTRATIGEAKIAMQPIATNQGFKSLIPRMGVSSEYLYYQILMVREELASYGTGSTFLEVSKRDVTGLKIGAPSSTEQSAIAGVLTDADDEIDVLRKQLSKAKTLKQGMMQELLTGRTRLHSREVSV